MNLHSAIPVLTVMDFHRGLLAEHIAKFAKRLKGFVALPLQDPQAAAQELTRCVKELGFCGALANGFSQISEPESAVLAVWFRDIRRLPPRRMLMADPYPNTLGNLGSQKSHSCSSRSRRSIESPLQFGEISAERRDAVMIRDVRYASRKRGEVPAYFVETAN